MYSEPDLPCWIDASHCDWLKPLLHPTTHLDVSRSYLFNSLAGLETPLWAGRDEVLAFTQQLLAKMGPESPRPDQAVRDHCNKVFLVLGMGGLLSECVFVLA